MVAPTITANLTLINNADSATTNWDKFGAGGQVGADADIYIQDSGVAANVQKSVVTTVNTSEVGLQYNGGDATSAWTAQDHLYVWANYTAPAKLQTTALGGQRICFGNQGNNVDSFFVGGSEAEYIAGGWRCLVASPNQTVQNGTIGTPYTSYGAAGLGAEGVGKDNFLVDVIRYGRGLQITDGGGGNVSGTMQTFTDENDTLANQYGVARASGAGAQIQGEILIGHEDATSTLTEFIDANYAIFNPNKNPLSGSSLFATLDTFTGFRILGSGTIANISNFSFSSADDYDKGYLSCQPSYPFSYASGVAPSNVVLDGCTFTDWGQTRVSSATTVSNSTWIGCQPITLNTAIMDNCTVEAGIGGTYVFAGSTPNNISNTSFITPTSGVGTGHAIEVTASGSYSFIGNTFQDENGDAFGVTDTDTAAIHVKGAGVDAIFNITGDATASPTYKLTGVGATVSFVASVNVNVTGIPVITGDEPATEIRVLGAGTTQFLKGDGTLTDDQNIGIGTENHKTSTFSFSLKKDVDFDLRIINLDYVPQFISSIRAANDPTNIPANLKLDRVFSNPS